MKEIFPESDYEHKIKESFQFLEDMQPSLEIVYSSESDLELTNEKGNKVYVN